MYSCSGRRISFVSNCGIPQKQLITKEISRAEYEYMNKHPPTQLRVHLRPLSKRQSLSPTPTVLLRIILTWTINFHAHASNDKNTFTALNLRIINFTDLMHVCLESVLNVYTFRCSVFVRVNF